MRNRGTLTKFIVNYPVAVILIIVIATVVMGYGLTKIKVDTDPTDDIPDSIPAKKFYDEVGKIFPSNDFAFVALHSDKGIFTIKNLKLIKTLTEDIQKVAGVKKVISLYNAGIIRGTEEGLVIERPLQEKPVDRLSSEDIKIIKNKLIKNELTGSLISEDIKSTAIIATLKEGVDDEPVPRIIMSINKKSLDKNT